MTKYKFSGRIIDVLSRRGFMNSFKEILFGKKSFIYQVGNTYYAIGANTFSEVTDSAELDNIELLKNALKKENDRQIAKYLEKIMRIANTYRVDGKEHYKVRDKLFQFIDELGQKDKEALKSLQVQVFQIDELIEKYQ